MKQSDISQLAERVRLGRPTIVLGTLPPLPNTLETVRVRCDLPSTLGPLDWARCRIDLLLDGGSRDASHAAARRRELGVDGPRSLEERFTTACNRLAARAPGRVALVLDAIDSADVTTHKTLARALSEPGRLLLPLILVVHAVPHGSFLEVVKVIAHAGSGTDVGHAPLGQLHPAPAAGATPTTKELGVLDARVARVLRAASMIGPSFETAVVARLLDLSEGQVLDALQVARDAGLPIHDDAHDHFEMPMDLREWLATSILPSLQRHWHRRLGELFSDVNEADPLRSATHLADAGERERALERRLAAVAMLVRAGDIERAGEQLAATKVEIDALPRGAFAATLRARAKLERARLGWLGEGADSSFTLPGALEAAVEARTELGEVSPARIRADVASTIAGIAYDLGDGASLERAEKVLNETVASLCAESAMVEAATLLNDQAAISLRMGQRIRALELLSRSRVLLTAHVKEVPADAEARLDLAETHHLLARLPFHASGGPLPPTAISTALEHARAAETTYRELGMRRELGRVTETQARLEAKRGSMVAARAAFAAAMELADEVGDLTGLARITAGFAELLSTAGTPRVALDMLVRSIELNEEKGSPIGLAFDERVLGEVETAIAAIPKPDPALQEELTRARARLVAAIEATS